MTNTDDILTAKHWTPDTLDAWNAKGDLRDRIVKELLLISGPVFASSKYWPKVEPATTMDPENPDPVVVLASNWHHCDVHGVMTPEIFYEDLEKAIHEFATMIFEDRNPFRPVRIYKDAAPAYSVGFFDWRGDEYPFDLRALVQFGQWEFTTDKGEKVTSAGYKFHISTLCLPDEQDVDVHVGRDWAKYFDETT